MGVGDDGRNTSTEVTTRRLAARDEIDEVFWG